MSPDPSQGIIKQVKQWHVDTVCWPSWEEVLEIEYLRRFGNVHMFSDNVKARCLELGLTRGAEWYERMQSLHVLPSLVFGIAVKHYEQEHGSQDTWLSDDVVLDLQVKASV